MPWNHYNLACLLPQTLWGGAKIAGHNGKDGPDTPETCQYPYGYPHRADAESFKKNGIAQLLRRGPHRSKHPDLPDSLV